MLNGLEAGADPADYAAYRLEPAIGGAEELERWAAFARAKGRPLAVRAASRHRHAPARLRVARLAQRAPIGDDGAASGADLLMSHFVSSEIPDDPLNGRSDRAVRGGARGVPAAARLVRQFVRDFPDARPIHDLARPGYALYGGNPDARTAEPDAAGRDARRRDPADAMDRGGRDAAATTRQWTASRRTRLATLLAGYADGLPRAAGATDGGPAPRSSSPAGRARWSGRVSMDLIIADVTDLPEDAVAAGRSRGAFRRQRSRLDEFAVAERHDRLSGADGPQRALSAKLRRSLGVTN